MKTDLTRRQGAFLEKLKEMYQRSKKPIHYAQVAKELGVSRFSAYDMLQLLEQKGLAGRQYIRGENRVGPGRSMVVFYPKDQASSLALVPSKSINLGEEWQQLRQTILERLRTGEQVNDHRVLSDALPSLPGKSPLEYCAEMIEALLLNLQEGMERAMQARVLQTLQALAKSGEMGLGALAGLSLGKALRGQDDASLTDNLLSRVQAFQEYLSGLSEESKSALVDFMQDAVLALDSEQ
ncbi:MAG: hypothetical protein L6435_00395 [Anaerolineae bacterium]|nr:hypothetical protein [Anaerolineae bacterium]